ncbi:U-box domain-containing protein 70 isoform X1 [Nematostella vectensis]|uniref:U-box domain-containing protein 70 isoform X1 n=1 Tax=Nematostella vectensis TaxID=45351 RepID=UPI00138FD210|nr:U-box domain-containing protein 70 isoform X1 [Nematostella vectensis]
MAPSKTLLGSGTFGSVYSKLSKTRVVAVKVLSQHAVSRKGFFDRNQDDVFRENLLLTCHPNIVKILRVEQIKRNFAHGVVITMELMLSFDDLAGKLMGCHRLETIAKFVREVAEALSFLHSRDPPVVHRYLTPRNILFGFNSIRTELIAKVSDAGLAQALESAHSEEDFRIIPSRYNTQFMAPETMGYVCSPRIVYHPKMDIYSLGIILLTMVNGSPPDTQAYPLDSQTDAAWQAKLNKALTKLGENNPLRLIAERMVSEPTRRPTA